MPIHDETFLCWSVAGATWRLGEFPKIMGIVNVTPDSFSDGGQCLDPDAAVEHAWQLAEQGADILDVGGESTRPGAEPVPVEEELRRVIPVIAQLAKRTDVPISIDTTKAVVAREALAAGASIVNDVSAGTCDPEMIPLWAGSDCGLILMHMQGTPQTMQLDPRYEDVVNEIREYLRQRVASLSRAGIAEERIVIDPGIGFGKTAEHNLEILSRIGDLRALGRPVLIGHSRKRFLGKILRSRNDAADRTVDERLAGTIGVSIALAEQHVDLLRVHDVAAVKDALTAWHTVATSSATE
jgi:dihydropteroate synthase